MISMDDVQANAHSWTFLTNHSHVLICLAREPERTLREVAAQVGITERAVQRIVAELVDAGYLHRSKDGRQNRYTLKLEQPLRHPIEANCHLRDLVDLIR